LDKLVERFLFSELTFLVSHDFRGWLENRGNFNIITLTPKQANCFQLPRRKLLNSLKIKMFEVAIDLNPQDTLFSSILCLASGAKVRVGFNGEDSDNYFNFQVLPQRSEDPRGKYSALLNYLQ
jgi:ADP-heptose:LPS heptosyltransferase